MGGRWRRLLALAGVAVLAGTGLVACGDGVGTANPLDVEFRELEGGNVRISSSSSVGAGLVQLRFKNSGSSTHQAQLFRVTGDHTRGQVLEFLRASERPGSPIPSWIRDGGGATVEPGETVTAYQRLTEGDWYLADTSSRENADDAPPFYERGGLVSLTVTSGGSDGGLPGANSRVVANDYSFRTTGLRPGRRTVRFENRGRQMHQLVAAPLRPGRTIDEARAFFTSNNPTDLPAVDFDKGVLLPVIDRRNVLVTDITLTRGTYVLACFVNDRSGGPPHTAKGMLQVLQVG